ncbi:MAG: hypothetical protein V7849_08735, partial [Candidatus Competibacter sp.]
HKARLTHPTIYSKMRIAELLLTSRAWQSAASQVPFSHTRYGQPRNKKHFCLATVLSFIYKIKQN